MAEVGRKRPVGCLPRSGRPDNSPSVDPAVRCSLSSAPTRPLRSTAGPAASPVLCPARVRAHGPCRRRRPSNLLITCRRSGDPSSRSPTVTRPCQYPSAPSYTVDARFGLRAVTSGRVQGPRSARPGGACPRFATGRAAYLVPENTPVPRARPFSVLTDLPGGPALTCIDGAAHLPLELPCNQATSATGMEHVRLDFHQLLDNATNAELRASTNGTRWTNEQLLFHMLFGYLLVHNLLPLVGAFAPATPTRLQAPSRQR